MADIDSARLCRSFGKEKPPVPEVDPGSARDESQTAAFSLRNRSLEIVQAKKKKNQWLYNTSATSTLNMKQELGSSEQQKSLLTTCTPHTELHWKRTQRSFAQIFLPAMADVNLLVKVSARGL